MARATAILRQASTITPVSHATQKSPLVYSLGLSYASKASPPFVAPNAKPEAYGFAGQSHHRLGKWVDEMMRLRAGRGELRGEKEGGWEEGLDRRRVKWGAGEDFFGICEGGGYTHLAVSDGVGGWAPQYDPSLFSQALMHRYITAATSSPSSAPWQLLEKAYAGVLSEDKVPAGSATAVGVALADTGSLRGVNLGDSGLTVLREDEPVYTTPVQTHYFNCPLQLTKAPKGDAANLASDKPESGFRFSFDLQPGDIVALYTDGLSDNLPTAHMNALSSRVSALLKHPQNAHLAPADRADEKARILADVLVGYGRMAMARTGQERAVGEDGKEGPVGSGWKTPFETEAARMGIRYPGGKVDDITVITAVVSERL